MKEHKSIKYIRNSKTFNGWLKTVSIAIKNCKDLDAYEQIVEACYDKHDYFVYYVGIEYDLSPSRYGNLLEEIRKITRTWYENYCEQNGIETEGFMYGFTSF